MFQADTQIIERPKCKNSNCSNDAFIYCAGGFYCGVCVNKLNNKMNKYMIEQMEAD